MINYHLGALHIAQTLVRVHATALVFSEEGRILHLADIVIEGTCPCQLSLGTNPTGSFEYQIRHLHRVLECAWG